MPVGCVGWLGKLIAFEGKGERTCGRVMLSGILMKSRCEEKEEKPFYNEILNYSIDGVFPQPPSQQWKKIIN